MYVDEHTHKHAYILTHTLSEIEIWDVHSQSGSLIEFRVPFILILNFFHGKLLYAIFFLS